MKQPVTENTYVSAFIAKHERMPTWIPSGEYYINDFGEICNMWVHPSKSDKIKYAALLQMAKLEV